MLGEFEDDERSVIADLEAGVGTLLRMEEGLMDLVLVICEPSAKSMEVASRAAAIASTWAAVVVVANRVRDGGDVDTIHQTFPDHDLIVIPEDPAIIAADREGLAPFDYALDAPGVQAIGELAQMISGRASEVHESRDPSKIEFS